MAAAPVPTATSASEPPLRLLQRWVPHAPPRPARPAGWAAVGHALRQLVLPR